MSLKVVKNLLPHLNSNCFMNLKGISQKLGLTGRIMGWLILVAVVVASVTGYLAFTQGSKALIEAREESLAELAEAKELNTIHLILLRMEQVKELAGTFLPKQLSSDGNNSPETIAAIQGHIEGVLKGMNLDNAGFYEDIDKKTAIAIIGVWDKDGVIVANTDGSLIGKRMPNEFLQKTREQGSYFRGFEQDVLTGENFLMFTQAITSNTDGKFVGVMLFKIRAKILNVIMNDPESPIGETGQAFIVNRDRLLITEGRFDKDTVLTQKVEVEVINNCIENVEHSVSRYESFTGKDVVGAVTRVGDLGWCIVVELGVDEVLAPTVVLRNSITIAALVIIAIILVAAIFIARSIGEYIRRPIRRAVKQMNAASQQLSSSTQQSAAAAQQNSSIAQQVASGSTEQSSKAEEISKSITDMAAAIQDMSSSSKEASAAAAETSKLAQDTGEKGSQSKKSLEEIKTMVAGTAEMIRGMSDKSKSIGDIVDTITTIAEQTNLLALNAAIEAARAGDAGRGFAVVADEVRKLAEGSGKAAEEIKGRIKDMLDQIDDSVATVETGVKRADESSEVINETLSNLQNMAAAIQQVTAKIQEVTAGVDQQSAAVQQVAKSMDAIATISEQNASGAQQLSASAQQQSSANQQVAAAAQQLQGLSDDLAIISGGMKKHTEVLEEAKKPILLTHGQVKEAAEIAAKAPSVEKVAKAPKTEHSEIVEKPKEQKKSDDDDELSEKAHKVTNT